MEKVDWNKPRSRGRNLTAPVVGSEIRSCKVQSQRRIWSEESTESEEAAGSISTGSGREISQRCRHPRVCFDQSGRVQGGKEILQAEANNEER